MSGWCNHCGCHHLHGRHVAASLGTAATPVPLGARFTSWTNDQDLVEPNRTRTVDLIAVISGAIERLRWDKTITDEQIAHNIVAHLELEDVL